VFTHASNVTGAVNDVPRLAAAAKSAGAAAVLDASQTLGCIPVRPDEWGIDMMAFTGHKYLLGPQGTGGLYTAPGVELAPLLVGGTGVKSDLETMPGEMPMHLEAGTGNEPSFHGLLAALKWAAENPPDRDRTAALMEKLRAGLRGAGAAVIDPVGESTPVVSFNLPGKTADEAGYILSECYDITCRSGLHCAPKIFEYLGCPATVRLSLSRFTTADEVDEAVSAVKETAAG
jgi:selenocysteine lyase/cysteine desulfurase